MILKQKKLKKYLIIVEIKATDNKLPLYQIVVSNDSDIEFISLVKEPAIEVNWAAFSESKKYRFEQIGDQQKLAGPFAIPDLPIYRVDQEMGEYYVVFTKDAIEKLAEKFNSQAKSQNINFEHTENSKVNGAFVSENWIVEDAQFDKSKKFGFDLPIGSWFGIVKIEDSEFWKNYVKDGKVMGFSIEGMLGISKIKNSKMNKNLKFAEATTKDGTKLAAESFEVGKELYLVAADGNQNAAPDGEYNMEDGTVIVSKDGKITEVKAAVEQSSETPAKLALAPEDMQAVLDALKPNIAEWASKLAGLEDRVTMLENTLKDSGVITEEMKKKNEEMSKKLEEFSKLPGATSVVKKPIYESPKKMTMSEQVEKLRTFKTKK